MAIELSLEVTDKGSATVSRAASNMSASLRTAEMAASRLGGQFERIGNRMLHMTAGLFSWHHNLTMLVGGTGLILLTRQLMELGEQAGNEQFNAALTGVKDKWGEFTDKIGDFVANSPAVQDGLKGLATEIGNWGKALDANKGTIEAWAKFAADSIKGVARAITSGMQTIAQITAAAPISSMSEQQVAQRLNAALAGEDIGLGGAPNATSAASTYHWSNAYPSKSVVNNNVFNQQLNRSDIQNIISEMERSEFRGSSGGSSSESDYEWGGAEQGF